MTEQVKVTQADREAAALMLGTQLHHQYPNKPHWVERLCQKIRDGEQDQTEAVQSLARHRIAAQAELLEALEDAERGLLAITVALAEQEFSTVAQKVGAYAERAGAAIAKAKGEV